MPLSETYTVTVHVDADGDMVIIQNPTLAPAMEKSDYEPKAQEADNSVDADTVNDAIQNCPKLDMLNLLSSILTT